jgi:hypothetical protein
MRASMLALAGILVCAASAASAQAVIDVEGQRAAQPPVQDQPAAQPQPQLAPPVAPQPTPKVESPAQPKSDSAAPPADGGRFTFNRIDNGFLRLDTQSGQVAYCRQQAASWACRAVPENQSGLEADVARLQTDIAALKTLQSDMTGLKTLKSDIARLQDEIAALRREVAALKEPPPPADLTSPDKGPDVAIRLPTHDDVARARAFLEKTWHRLVEMITAVQKDMMQKS